MPTLSTATRRAKALAARTRLGLELRRHRGDVLNIERYVTFVGHPRNASTFLGAVIDAHPDAVICHELGALGPFLHGMPTDRWLWQHVRAARRFAKEEGLRWEGYDYAIDPQWQGGRFRRLRVIGDKRARLAAEQLREHPTLPEQLSLALGVPLSFVHVVRNPLDNLTTITRRKETPLPLQEEVDRFFRRCDAILKLSQDRPDEYVEVHHEDLVRDPRAVLVTVAGRLGLDADNHWLDAAAAHTFATSPRTRDDIDWPAALVEQVIERAAAYPWFARN